MILLLTAIDELGETREFSCQLPQLESGFNLLTYMDAHGHTLVKARVMGEEVPAYFPAETIDKDPVSPIILELPKDWRQTLDKLDKPDSGVNQLTDEAPKPVMDHCLIYFSTSVWLFEEEDLATILAQSRRNNAKAGVTGLLLYMNGNVIQVLEGNKEVVNALYKRIAQDQRHTHVVCVLNSPVDQRLFARWSMAYETLTASQFAEVESVVALTKWREAQSKPDDSIILKTLKAFYETNRR